MKTDVIFVSGGGKNLEIALSQADKAAQYKALSPKSSLCLKLLTEETISLMRALAGTAKGEFWIEDRDGMYEIHLRVDTQIDEEKRMKLLSASSSGKNEAARGFMGKIRSFFDVNGGFPLLGSRKDSPVSGSFLWTMEEYRDQLQLYRQQHPGEAMSSWDELEKS